MRKALKTAERLWLDAGAPELVVTCGLNGEHSAGSLHYYGYAVDIRIKNLPIYEEKLADTGSAVEAMGSVEALSELLQEELGADYYVLLHNNHVHIHWKKALS